MMTEGGEIDFAAATYQQRVDELCSIVTDAWADLDRNGNLTPDTITRIGRYVEWVEESA